MKNCNNIDVHPTTLCYPDVSWLLGGKQESRKVRVAELYSKVIKSLTKYLQGMRRFSSAYPKVWEITIS